ncbi:hypothetical protein CAJAP_06636 [Camponotus japonicus]
MIEYPTCHAVPRRSEKGPARFRKVGKLMTSARAKVDLDRSRRREGGKRETGLAACWFNFGAADRRSERRTISPRLGRLGARLSPPLLLLSTYYSGHHHRSSESRIKPANSLLRVSRGCDRMCRECEEAARTRRRSALAAGEQDLTDCNAALCRRSVQWVIQSVGRRQRAGSEEFTRAAARLAKSIGWRMFSGRDKKISSS